jgi:hypothetical protein
MGGGYEFHFEMETTKHYYWPDHEEHRGEADEDPAPGAMEAGT